jgi:hypothetical protein
MTTKALQSLIDKATALSPDLQERFAQQWLAELEDEQPWEEALARPQGGNGTFADLLKSGLVGIWKDRTDIGDSLDFARELRKQAETRHHEIDNPE